MFVAELVTSSALAISPEFSLANQRYDEGKFEEAKQLYQTLVAKGEYTANVFYNLGNVEWRLDHPGAAALNFERTLALDSSHPEARANLNFIREKTGAKFEDRRWLDHAFVRLPNGAYTIATAIAAWALLFGLAILAFRPAGKRGGALMAGITAMLVCAYAATAACFFEGDNKLAIVTAKRAEARMAPADSSALADNLPAGSQVRIIAERGSWFYCVLPNQQSAWISAKDLERVPLEDA